MKRRFAVFVIFSMFSWRGCMVTPAVSSTAQPMPKASPSLVQLRFTELSASDAQAANRLTLTRKDSTTIVDVVSPSGIGLVRMTTTTGTWPQRLIVRLHLQALEEFMASNGDQHFHYAWSSEQNARRVQQGRTGQTLPPIEVEVPQTLLGEGVASLTIHWVDWYRR